jgi:hypothetical protein
MTGDSAPGSSGKRSALLAIAVGGGIAGALDLTQAAILFGWVGHSARDCRGLLGPAAFRGRVGAYVLGVLLHFFIACSTAAVY